MKMDICTAALVTTLNAEIENMTQVLRLRAAHREAV
jgi:hypothetical protein